MTFISYTANHLRATGVGGYTMDISPIYNRADVYTQIYIHAHIYTHGHLESPFNLT